MTTVGIPANRALLNSEIGPLFAQFAQKLERDAAEEQARNPELASALRRAAIHLTCAADELNAAMRIDESQAETEDPKS